MMKDCQNLFILNYALYGTGLTMKVSQANISVRLSFLSSACSPAIAVTIFAWTMPSHPARLLLLNAALNNLRRTECTFGSSNMLRSS